MAGAIQLTEVDFEEIKLNLINYLKSTKQFTDYDFSGSNLQVILNLIAYQSQLNAYSTNMIANESFLSSASLRNNVVSCARQVGYVPTSTKAAGSTVSFDFELESEDFPSGYPPFLMIKPGMAFSTNTGQENLTFNFVDTQVAPVNKYGIAVFNNKRVYQGTYLSDEFTVDDSNFNQKFVLQNQGIDTTLLRVEVQLNPNEEVRTFFQQANNLVEVGAESNVYWIEETGEQYYELTFGDGFFGRKLKNGAKIFVHYLVCDGERGNGIQATQNFRFIGKTETSEGNVVSVPANINSASVSQGGASIESIESIKFRAPRSYATQNRAVIAQDYKNLVQTVYPGAQDVYVYGGEELEIPEYGRVFIAIKPNNGDTISNQTKQSIIKSLNEYRVASLELILTDPDILYVELDTIAYFNDQATIKDSAGIISTINETLNSRAISNVTDKFGGYVSFSQIMSAIDGADPSITRNNTIMKMRKDIQVLEFTPSSYEICFEQALKQDRVSPVVQSTGFKLVGDTNLYFMEDDTNGNLYIYYFDDLGNPVVTNKTFGTVDYNTGELQIGYVTPVTFQSTELLNSEIQIRALPFSQDVVAKKSVYLDLDVEGSTIRAVIETGVGIS